MHSSYVCNPRVETGGSWELLASQPSQNRKLQDQSSKVRTREIGEDTQHPFLASTRTCTCIPPHIQGPNIARGQRSRVTYQFSSLSRVSRYPIFPLRTLGNKVRRHEDLELGPPHPVPFPHLLRVRVTSLTGGPFGPGNPGGPCRPGRP